MDALEGVTTRSRSKKRKLLESRPSSSSSSLHELRSSSSLSLSSSPSLTASVNELRKDELVEIFLRLPLKCLHRVKCVSKYWLVLISSPEFIRCYIEHHVKLAPCDHFILYHARHSTDYGVIGEIELPSRPIQLSLSTDLFDFSLKFIPLLRDFPERPRDRCRDPLSNFTIVAASHGLLLCMATFKRSCDAYHPRTLFVCNPLTKQFFELPRLGKRYSKAIARMGFLCYSLDDDNPFQVGFSVLEVEHLKKRSSKFQTHVFSSKEGSWSLFHVACPVFLQWSSCYGAVVVYKGVFHWIADTHVVAYDPVNQPHKCNVISLPTGWYKSEYFHQSKGQLRVVSLVHFVNFRVFGLTDYDNGTWCLLYDVKFPKDFGLGCFSETDEEIVCLVNYLSGELMLNNMSSSLSQPIPRLPLTHKRLSQVSGLKLLPFVMTSWPTVFTVNLAGGSS